MCMLVTCCQAGRLVGCTKPESAQMAVVLGMVDEAQYVACLLTAAGGLICTK